MTRILPTFVLPLAGAILVNAAAAAPQDAFVERALELGIVHHSLAGFDRIGGMVDGVWDYAQTGVGIGDLDGDGDPDLVLAGGLLPNTVLRNDGTTFTDVTHLTDFRRNELDRCVALGDYDDDGDLDVYLGSLRGGHFAMEGRSRLYRNEGGFSFTDVTDLAGVAGRGHSLFAQFFDVDHDGLLDLYVGEFHVTQNAFYLNNGDGTFRDAGTDYGVDFPGSAHATSFLDSDGDGELDLFIGNDYLVGAIVGAPANFADVQLSAPPGGGPFVNVGSGSGMDVARGIMGFAWGDPDYDGDLDLYKTDVGSNYLFLNHGWPTSGSPWTEAQHAYGIVSGHSPWPHDPSTQGINSSWAPLFFCADFDVWDDFFVTNGHVAGMTPGDSKLPRFEANDFYWGQGPSLPFVEDTAGAGLFDEIDDRGLAAGDLDGDGDLDLVVTALKSRARLYENRIDPDGQGWLQVVPVARTSAPGGIGTRVVWTDSQGLPHTRALGSDAPTASTHEVLAHFGLGNETAVTVAVTFPSGVTKTLTGVTPDQRIYVEEPLLVRLSERALPVASEAPAGVDRLVVDAFAHDATGAKLTGQPTVTIDAPGLVPLTDVTHLGGIHYRREFQLATTPGSYPVSVSFDGWTPRVSPVARFRGAASAAMSSVDLHPTAVRAGTADSFELVVVPRDDAGMAIGSGQPMLLSMPGCAPLGAVVDHGDGRYTRRFQAPTTAGVYASAVQLGGWPLATSASLDAAGVPAQATEVMLQLPNVTQSASDNEVRLCVTPRDAAGLRLGPGADVQVIVRTSPTDPESMPGSYTPAFGGRKPVTPATGGGALGTGGPTAPPVGHGDSLRARLRGDIDCSGQEDGEFRFAVTVDPAELGEITGTLAVRVDGVLVGLVPFSI